VLNNIRLYERYLRVVAGFALVAFGAYASGWQAVAVAGAGVVLFYTGESGYCAVYHMLGVNRQFATANHFLSELPRHNDEPVLVFNRRGELLFQNDSSKKKVPGVRSLDDILRENIAVVFEHDAESLPDLRLSAGEQIYRFHAKRDVKNDLLYMYGTDVTDLEAKKARLQHEVITDALTGIGNRHKLVSDEAFHKALISIDIARFAEVNSFLGHRNADRYLVTFTRLLNDFIKAHYYPMEVYRIGGDIFTIAVGCAAEDEGKFREELGAFTEELVDYFGEVELQVEGVDVSIDIVAGVAFRESSGKNTFKDSQTALLEAKKHRTKFVVYDDLGAIEKQYEANIYWSKRLKSIFQDPSAPGVIPYYQPIYNLSEGRVEKFESLARVVEGDRVISPLTFIASAKKTKLIPKLTAKMLDRSLAEVAKAGYEVSINVTLEDFENKILSRTLEKWTGYHGIEPSKIVVEVLEDEEMYDYVDYLKELRNDGYKIAIDDFGTGYSNFAKLQAIGADYIKIDGSLVKHVDQNPNDAALIRSIVEYARSIGAKTVAEYVHSASVFETVRALGVDYAQGYYIGEPSRDIEVTFTHG